MSGHALAHRLLARLKFKHLRLLLLIRQLGSLTRVAEVMATTQPALTHALAELEDIFGTALFQRSARGMRPTALGEVVLAHAQAMVKDIDGLAIDMEAVSSGRDAHLRVGVVSFVSGRILSAAVEHARAEGYKLSLTVHEGTGEELLASLRDHGLDLVVGRASTVQSYEGMVHDVLYRQPPRLIANRRLAARLSRQALSWQELSTLDWILGPRHSAMREALSGLFLRDGVMPPQPVVESYSSRLIGDMLTGNDRAASVVPADVAEELVQFAGVVIVPFSFQWSLPPVALFQLAARMDREANQRYAGALREVSSQWYGRGMVE